MHGRLFLEQLYVALIGELEFLEVLIDLPQLICVLLEALLQSLIDILLPASLLLLLELLDALGHALASLLRSFLHGHDFFLVGAILFEQHLCQFLPE